MGNQVARCMYMVGIKRQTHSRTLQDMVCLPADLISVWCRDSFSLTVPAAGNTKRQIKFITDFGTTCLHIIPRVMLPGLQKCFTNWVSIPERKQN